MRQQCSNCKEVLELCYCHIISFLNNKTKILVLQSPNEQKHHLSSIKVAQRTLSRIKVFKGINFTNCRYVNDFIKEEKPILIYPTSSSTPLESIEQKDHNITSAIIIDGTWRKTFQIFQLSKNLHSLRSIHFCQAPESKVYLRKPPKKEYLSTIESISYFLEYVEEKSFEPMLKPLLYLQDKIWEKIPEDKRLNYKK